MAAGLGFKTFTTGEVLTAADVNGYLMQGVLVFASEAARNSAITAPQEGQFAFTKDTNSLWYYSGSAWVASGATGDIEGVTAGVGISGGGTSGTVTITNDMATTITASGDIVVGTGSGTYDNLPIGSTGNVLTADTTVSPYKVKWAAPAAAASGLTKIAAATFSNVASVSVDSVFSATYTNYIVIVNASAGTSGDDFQFQFRYSGNTQTATYYGSGFGYNRANVLSNWGFVNTSQTTLATSCGSNAGTSGTYTLNVSRVGSGSQGPVYYGSGIVREEDDRTATITGYNDTARVYDGFLLKSSSSNITGSYAVYGVQA
jgi:hypothetical protein